MLHDLDDHYRLIENAVLSGADKPDALWRVASWRRCLQDFKLSPTALDLVCLTTRELREETDLYTEDIKMGGQELEQTLSMIEGGGYSAHIANKNGIIIAERTSRDASYYCSVDRIGAVWSEEIGGTNGIGTSLKERRPTSVYLADHFYADLTGQACASAPFFDPYGNLLGIINLSTRNPGVPQLAHRVVFGVAQTAADRLETAYFRVAFRNFYTVTLNVLENTPAIFAIDKDCRIIGANHRARSYFRIDDTTVGVSTLWTLFEKVRGLQSPEQACDAPKDLRILGKSTTVAAIFRRPDNAPPTLSTPSSRMRPSPAQTKKQVIGLSDCAGSDPQMQRNVNVLKKVIGTGLNLLLLGETGVGKDTLARAIHTESNRSSEPFVAFNCAAVPEALIDSELFGYSPGAFTGANKEGNPGRIVDADRGTLFLDEIGDMPLPLQTRFLRFLETQEVIPLGSGKSRQVDVQVIAATHQDLQAKVSMGQFRQDLFYRLAGTVIVVPPLRERSDLPQIINNLMRMVSDGPPLPISDAAMGQLLSHNWPGNVRELRNVLTRAARLADGVIGSDDLMLHGRNEPSFDASPSVSLQDHHRATSSTSSKAASEHAIRVAIQNCIARHGTDIIACSSELGISRATLYRKMKQFGLSLPRAK